VKRVLLGFFVLSEVACATPAFAAKADYCAAYARDFADAQTRDKTLWQHKYDIASEACMAAPKAPVQEINAKPKLKKPKAEAQIAVPAEPQTTTASAKLKLEPGSENWNTYCANKYTSFNAKTGTYTSRSGVERKCVVSYP
jgi:BA14K-like protein